jgi:subtilisin family serine protease
MSIDLGKPIDPDKLKLDVLEPDPQEQTQKAIPRAVDKKGGKNGKAWRLQFDPHLQEETRREACNQPPSLKTSRKNGHGPRKVDVIAKVNKDIFAKALAGTKEPVDGLHVFQPIGGGIVTGKAEVKKIPAIRQQLGEEGSLKEATDLYLDLFHSVPATHCDLESLEQGAPGVPGLDGSGVLIGIVDVGCDFRHKNFRYPSGATRIRYLWDQTVSPDSAKEVEKLAPDGFHYGQEFTADQINQALKTGEDTAYNTLGYTPIAGAHGTHVMDIAAGNGREPALFGGKEGPTPAVPSHPGVAPNAQIIFVHLRTFEGGELGNSRHLLEAVYYIFKKAKELNLPAVVNLSLSTSGGPHDGTTLIEQGFKALVEEKSGRAIVTSAGNASQKQAHLSGKIGEGKSVTILWHTDPRHIDPDTTRNEMEIWYPQDQELQVTLYAPGGRRLNSVSLGDIADLNEYPDDTSKKEPRRVGRVSHRYNDPNNHDNQIDIRVPHLSEKPWQIELKALKGDIEFHAWIEQDDQGLSSFDGETDPFYTLSSISCSDATLTVGAFDTADNACFARPFDATSAGPTRLVSLDNATKKTKRDKPDLGAPGVRIVAARAQGGVTVLSGTSMAAAHVTGLVALVLQLALRSGRGPLLYSKIREVLTGGADALAADASHLNLQLQLGAGRIDGTECMKEVLKLDSGSEADQRTRPGLATSLPETTPAVISANDLLHKLIVQLAQKEGFELKVGDNGIPTNAVLRDLVNKLKNENDYNLNVTPPD